MGHPFHKTTAQMPVVLLVDDDEVAVDIFRVNLAALGVAVAPAYSSREALRYVHANIVDLMVLDQRLGDGTGLEVVDRVAVCTSRPVPFILVSAFLSVADCIAAVRLGVREILEKPVEIEQLTAAVLRAVGVRPNGFGSAQLGHEVAAHTELVDDPQSVIERWVAYVVRSAECQGDFRTIKRWAKFLGLSSTALAQICRLLEIRPHDARDFARMFRATALAGSTGTPIAFLLDVSDSRTLAALFRRSGINTTNGCVSVSTFLDKQNFINPSHEALRLLRRHVPNICSQQLVPRRPSGLILT